VTADAGTAPAPELSAQAAAIAAGYRFSTPTLNLGALMENGAPNPAVQIEIPLAMLNRHGLIAGATGTGKTKTLQLMAEQIALAGVPVFAADMKGDLTGLAVPGESSEKLLQRTAAIGQQWTPAGVPAEFYALGGHGLGVPLRTTLTGFGPTLLAKILGLSDVGTSCLELVYYYAAQNGLALVGLKDLRALLTWLTSDAGKSALEGIGGMSKATAGVILRELIGFSAQGADEFFGRPQFQSADFLRTTADGKGVVSLLELPNVANQPAVFSSFLMWLLTDLFSTLPEVGDLPKPKLVFFFDEAHLLFNGASKALVDTIAQTVRLIRSKGVGIFFITQQPTDVPDVVLAQLGSRIQHQLRAHTPNDQEALAKTVKTYPTSAYDLGPTLQALGTGEAIVTVMNPDGAPTPVAWTRMRAPQSYMGAVAEDVLRPGIQGSAMMAKYSTVVTGESAADVITRQQDEAAQMAAQQAAAMAQAKTAAEEAARAKAAQAQWEKDQAAKKKAEEKAAAEKAKAKAATKKKTSKTTSKATTAITRVATNAASQFVRSAISAWFRKK
jgi:DNA helicase HerA-like ATPase